MATNSTNLLVDLVSKMELNGTIPQSTGLSQRFFKEFRENLIFTTAMGKNYMKEATMQGVHIPLMEFTPTIHDYSITNGVPFEQFDYSFKFFPVTQHKAINILWDTVESSNSTVNTAKLFAKLVDVTARSKAEAIDDYCISKATDSVNGFPVLADTTPVSATNSYETVVAMRRVLTDANHSMMNLLTFADGSFTDALLLSEKVEKFGSNNAYDDIWKNGTIDKVAGVLVTEYGRLPAGVEAIMLDVNPQDPAMEFMMLFNNELKLRDINDGKHIDAKHLISRYIYEAIVMYKDGGVVKTVV